MAAAPRRLWAVAVVAALGLWAAPAQAQLRGAAAAATAAAGGEDVDTAGMDIRIIGDSLLLAGGIDHFHEVFEYVAKALQRSGSLPRRRARLASRPSRSSPPPSFALVFPRGVRC